MLTRRVRLASFLYALTCVGFLNGLSRAEAAHRVTSKELSDAIAELRSGKHEVEPDPSKDDAGAHLARLIKQAKPDQVGDGTISAIEALLDSPDDYIRAWAAISLGHLGPRAKLAIPKLLELLPVVDCLQGDLTSAGAVRVALRRIGAKPPFPTCKDSR